MNQTKSTAYRALVQKRKNDNWSAEHGYRNQSTSIYDTDEIGNYSTWANDLDADIMVVAQDYCDIDGFERCEGKVQKAEITQPSDVRNWETPTNYFLWDLLQSIGRDIGLPHAPRKAGVFITNAIVDLKPGGMTSKVARKVAEYSGTHYLKPLVEIVEPKVIIALGGDASKSLLKLYMDDHPEYLKRSRMRMAEIFGAGPFTIRNGQTTVYPMYHPGRLGQNGRKLIDKTSSKNGLELMKSDWAEIHSF